MDLAKILFIWVNFGISQTFLSFVRVILGFFIDRLFLFISVQGSIYSNNANCDLTEMPTASVDSSLCSVLQPTNSLGGVYDAVIYLGISFGHLYPFDFHLVLCLFPYLILKCTTVIPSFCNKNNVLTNNVENLNL